MLLLLFSLIGLLLLLALGGSLPELTLGLLRGRELPELLLMLLGRHFSGL